MKKYLLSAAIILLMVFVYSCKEEDKDDDIIPDDIDFSGIVIDNQDLPVPFAEIEFYEESASASPKAKPGLLSDKFIASDTTDEDGNFSVTIPDKDNIYMIIIHPDFKNKKYKIGDVKDKDGGMALLKGDKEDECTAVLNIMVEDEDGNAKSNSLLKLYRGEKLIKKAETDNDGKFTFQEVCPGEYTIGASKSGVYSEKTGVKIETNEEYSYTIIMSQQEEKDTCCENSLQLLLKDDESGDVINGTVILKKEGKENKSKKTENGYAKFEELCEGDYTIVIEKDGYERMEFEYTVDCDSDDEITKELKQKEEEEKDTCCKSVLYFYPIGDDGKVINGAKVIIYKDGKAIEDPVVKDGKAVVDGLCEGKYTIVIKAEGYEEIEFTVELDCNEEKEVEKEMTKKEENDDCCEGAIEFNFKDKDSGNKANGTVILKMPGKENRSKKTENGQASFYELCEGKYTIVFESEDFERMEFTYELDCNDTVEVVKEVIAKEEEEKDTCCKSVMYFYPIGDDGNVLNGAKVIIYKDGKAIEDPVVKDGKAVVDGLCEGKYTIVIKAEGYKDIEFVVELGCNEEKEVEKEMTKKEEEDCCNSTFQIQLKDKDGNAVTGTVVLKKEGKENRSKKSENGYAKFEEVCEGKYTVVIESEGYERMEFTYEVECDKNIEISKTLEKKENEDDCCEGILWVGISDKDGNEIKADVIVKKDGKENRSEDTENNAVTFYEMCKGKHTIVIEAEGYKRMEFTFEQGCNDTVEISKVLEKTEEEECCDNKLTIVIEQDTIALDDVLVKLWRDGKVVKEAKSKNGEVVFEELCKGKYGVSMNKEGYQGAEFNIEFDCEENKIEYKTLKEKENDCCEAAIKSYVKDKDAKAIEGAEVEYWLDGKVVSQGKTNGDGYYYATDLCLGKYTIVIKKDGYNTIEETWEIKECKNHQETFTLRK